MQVTNRSSTKLTIERTPAKLSEKAQSVSTSADEDYEIKDFFEPSELSGESKARPTANWLERAKAAGRAAATMTLAPIGLALLIVGEVAIGTPVRMARGIGQSVAENVKNGRDLVMGKNLLGRDLVSQLSTPGYTGGQETRELFESFANQDRRAAEVFDSRAKESAVIAGVAGLAALAGFVVGGPVALAAGGSAYLGLTAGIGGLKARATGKQLRHEADSIDSFLVRSQSELERNPKQGSCFDIG